MIRIANQINVHIINYEKAINMCDHQPWAA
jgi:hypothetical protein